jgi:hypothetical protein
MRHKRSFLIASTIFGFVMCARPAAAQVACDALLASAEAATTRADACRATISDAQAVLADSQLPKRLTDYYAYEAFADGDARRCDALSFLGRDAMCRQIATELKFVRAWMGTQADFLSMCVAYPGEIAGQIKPQLAREWCGLVAENRGDSASLCAKAVPRFLSDAAVCRAYFFSLNGDVSACRAFPTHMLECQSDAAFNKAFKSRDVAQCDGSERCRVLLGGGRDVAEKIKEQLQSPAAGKWFSKQDPSVCGAPLRSEELLPVLNQAQACLKNSVGRGGQASAGTDVRLEKISALRRRVTVYLKSLAGFKKPAIRHLQAE